MLPLAQYGAADSPVLIGADRGLAAGEFFGRAAALAQALPPGSHVINLCESRPAFMVAFAAALLARRPSLLPPGQARGDWEALFEAHPGAILVSENPACEAARHPRFFDLRGALDATVPHADVATLGVPAEQTAAILFTSGSTGKPSAHRKTWGQLWQGAQSLAAALGWSRGEPVCIVGSVPPQHMFGLETTVLLPWLAGVPVHAARPLLPADLDAALRRHTAPGWWMTTPVHLRAALSHAPHDRGEPPPLAGIVASTMMLPAPLASAAEMQWRVPVMEIYGSTETGALATRRTAQGAAWRLLDGVKLARGGGENAVSASGGHVGAPVQLGDDLELGDGSFIWRGRCSDLVKVGGKRASLAALNQHLLEIPGVEDGAFFMPPEAEAGRTTQRPAAFYVAHGAAAPAPRAVAAALRERIDAVFVPRPLYRVDALPRNANGKLPQTELQDLFAQCAARQQAAPTPGAASEHETARAAFSIPADHPALAGHFPGNPIVPGVVILARVEAALRAAHPGATVQGLAAARFHAPLQPGQACTVALQDRGARIGFEVRYGGALVASGQWLVAASGGRASGPAPDA